MQKVIKGAGLAIALAGGTAAVLAATPAFNGRDGKVNAVHSALASPRDPGAKPAQLAAASIATEDFTAAWNVP